MEDSIKSSILAKFQQFSKEKEETAKEDTSSKRDSIPNHRGRGGFNGGRGRGRGGKRRFDQRLKSPTVGLTEKEVGITEYVSSSVGISGIIKHRFSDFQVHEIDLNGKVVILDSKELPEVVEVEEAPNDSYRSVLSDEQWAELDKIVKSEDAEKISIDSTNMDKEQRTKIHKAVKRAYGAQVCSNSVKEGDTVFIQIGRATNSKGERHSWPANQGRFLHFTVFKENMDTMHLVSLLSKHIRTKPNLITFAGTKDKRAKTSQRMCVKNKRAEHVRSFKSFKAHFGNYSYQHSPLRLGDLSGNKFTLAIRNVTKSDEEINEALTNIQSLGFINYFGLQRFGSCASMPTFAIGKFMLLEDWKGAVNAILEPKPGILSDVQEACETYAKLKDPVLALKSLGHRHDSSIEGKILSALKKQPNNFYDALIAIPRNSMLLYLHAYQSYVWNRVISRRVREFGLKPIAGDLVIVEEVPRGDDGASENGSGDKKNVKKDDDMNGDESDNDSDAGDSPEAAEKIRIEKVRKLTEEELDKTPLSEVVYPLPGNDVEFPGNVIEKWYFEVMEEDGITMDTFINSKKVFSMYGKYRRVLTEVRDLEWKIVKYTNTEADLILSDLDKMEGKSLPVVEDGNYKAVIMDFSLKSSVYATMMLREVMKCDTSNSYHAKLTKENHVVVSSEEPPEKLKKSEEDSG
uniref:Pseudouridylate synthase 7 n=1 Tax=Lygus hesperus TaxID=30085 RepID=A0A146L3C1_LYGHE